MKIRKKISIIFISLFILSFSITSIITGFIIEKNVTQLILNNLKSISTIQLKRIEDINTQNLERLKLISSRTQLKISLNNYNKNPQKKYQQKMNTILNDARLSVTDFEQISVINLKGEIVASTDSTKIGKKTDTDNPVFLQAQKQNITNIYTLDENNDLKIKLYGPLVYNNKILGLIYIISSSEKITKLVTDYSGLSTSGYVFILFFDENNNDKNIIISPRRENETLQYKKVKYEELGQISRNVYDKKPGVFKNILDYKQNPMFASTEYSENLKLGLSVRMSRADIFKSSLTLLYLLIIVIITMIIILILAINFSTKFISRPIVKLTEIADKISKGDLEQKIDINSKDEVGQLAKSFSSMLTNLGKAVFDRDQSIDSFRQTEKILLLERDNMNNIFEAMEDGIYIVNRQYEIQYVNPVLKKEFGPVDDKKCYKYFHNSDKPCAFCRNEDVFAGKTVRWEWTSFINGKTYDLIDTPIKNSDSTISKLEILRDITEHKQAEKKLKKHHKNLEKIVKERTKELENKNKKVTESQQALAYLLEDMNESSKQLSISNEQLEMANKELEAFSYSVSHDLRAPLRAIDGFTRILMEDYIANFDAEGKRLGSVIQHNAKKMGNLIDDLLAFSRMGRTSMSFSEIDMKNMVNAIYHETTTSEDRKRVKFTIGDLTKAEGDTTMMRHVWINLISNAVKFSAHRKQAVISVTCLEEKNKLIYCVKDNGAGFNMKYKDKLFGVFQRLHSEKEFEGTGVGLALVQRIIRRHGGEVWANGEVDNGAAFYFSLPKNRK